MVFIQSDMYLEKQYKTKKDSFYLREKQYVDRVIGALLLIVFFPVFFLIGVCIKLSSPGPVFFTQFRLGKNRKLFLFYKFRTMWHDAKERFPEFYAFSYSRQQIETRSVKPSIDPHNDPRITPLGKILRKTSLDELPNLINIIRGEMNFVGPRPELQEILPYFKKNQLAKFSFRPGITGYAQINGRGLLTFQETIMWDLAYVRERSFLTDMRILFKTIWVVMRGKGAF